MSWDKMSRDKMSPDRGGLLGKRLIIVADNSSFATIVILSNVGIWVWGLVKVMNVKLFQSFPVGNSQKSVLCLKMSSLKIAAVLFRDWPCTLHGPKYVALSEPPMYLWV